MLADVFSWWRAQLGDVLLVLWRPLSRPVRNAMLLHCDPGARGAWRLVRRRGGASRPLSTLSADAGLPAWRRALAARRRGEPVILALDQPFLSRRATLPAAAAANLDQVLRYEMDRLTPFAADDLLFTYHVLPSAPADGMITLTLELVPKAWVREPLAHLAALGIRPVALEAPGMDGPEGNDTGFGRTPRRIPLEHGDPVTRARLRLITRASAGACAVLALAVLAIPFIRQTVALAEVEERLALLRPRMEQVDALRRRIASGSAGLGQLAAARERSAAPLRVLGILTDLLPDDTVLTSLSLRRDKFTIEGQSAAAVRLIASMTSDPHLKNPAFVAPVTRGDNGKDVFTIQAGFGS